jgi:hypothetical protein
VLIVAKQEMRSQSLLHIVGTEYLRCTVLSQSLSTDVFREILGHVATTNMITIYVICIYNLRKPRPDKKGSSAIGRRRSI